jgi:hypothetical protein
LRLTVCDATTAAMGSEAGDAAALPPAAVYLGPPADALAGMTVLGTLAASAVTGGRRALLRRWRR